MQRIRYVDALAPRIKRKQNYIPCLWQDTHRSLQIVEGNTRPLSNERPAHLARVKCDLCSRPCHWLTSVHLQTTIAASVHALPTLGADGFTLPHSPQDRRRYGRGI